MDHSLKVLITDEDYEEYIYPLIPLYRFNTVKLDASLKKKFREHCECAWACMVFGVACGCIYLSQYDELGWTFDAYRNYEIAKKLDPAGKYGMAFAKIVIDYFFDCFAADKLFTLHDERSRAATIACKRLGFKSDTVIDSPLGKFEFMSLKRGDQKCGI